MKRCGGCFGTQRWSQQSMYSVAWCSRTAWWIRSRCFHNRLASGSVSESILASVQHRFKACRALVLVLVLVLQLTVAIDGIGRLILRARIDGLCFHVAIAMSET